MRRSPKNPQNRIASTQRANKLASQKPMAKSPDSDAGCPQNEGEKKSLSSDPWMPTTPSADPCAKLNLDFRSTQLTQGSGAIWGDRLASNSAITTFYNHTGTQYRLDQSQAPLLDALSAYRQNRIVSFDVPGHKQGRGNPELTNFLGTSCLSVDVNSMKPLDNLIHPVSVIKEAQALCADAFGARDAFFMVNGTSSAVQNMVLCSVGEGDKIIMPRNVHRSAINALILSGARPIYVDPDINQELGIPLGMRREQILKAIQKHPDAKAILVNNPTYYGVCADLKAITDLAHAHGMRVLVDEAHGTHFYFGANLPISAMAAGADMAAVSTHKTGGSLTQSSLLLVGDTPTAPATSYVSQILNLTQTTSASYLLMVSLDITRRALVKDGATWYANVCRLTDYARQELEWMGYEPFSVRHCDGDAFYAFDRTKLSIHTRALGLTGLEVYDLLRDDYGIQIEFGDLGNILAILSVGDRPGALERLLSALSEIQRLHASESAKKLPSEYLEPDPILSPKQAFFAPKQSLPRRQCIGRIAAEFVMCYPPGIPILAPGERIHEGILDYIESAMAHGASMTGPADPSLETLQVTV